VCVFLESGLCTVRSWPSQRQLGPASGMSCLGQQVWRSVSCHQTGHLACLLKERSIPRTGSRVEIRVNWSVTAPRILEKHSDFIRLSGSTRDDKLVLSAFLTLGQTIPCIHTIVCPGHVTPQDKHGAFFLKCSFDWMRNNLHYFILKQMCIYYDTEDNVWQSLD
jgi:hypothetical protein